MATEEIKFGTSEKERTDPKNDETKEVSITRWDNYKNQIEFFVQSYNKETNRTKTISFCIKDAKTKQTLIDFLNHKPIKKKKGVISLIETQGVIE